MQKTWSLSWEDSLEKGLATHSSILAWRIPWTPKSWTRLNDFHSLITDIFYLNMFCIIFNRIGFFGNSFYQIHLKTLFLSWGLLGPPNWQKFRNSCNNHLPLCCIEPSGGDCSPLTGLTACINHFSTPCPTICICCTQLCLTLCSRTDGSMPGPSAHGIFQSRILEWVAISFSIAPFK